MSESTIKNRESVALPIDFKISNGKIGGTDIDFVLEFDDKFLILVEVKKGDAEIPTGQRLLLERIADAWRESGRQAVVLQVSWSKLRNDGYIDLTKTHVRLLYNSEKQWKPMGSYPFIEALNRIGFHWGCKKCNF